MSSLVHSEGREDNFFYLNRDNEWPGFHFQGLEVAADGVVHLQRLPLLVEELPKEVETAEEPDGPAGLEIDVEGNLYFTDPAGNHVWKVDGCDGEVHQFLCREEIGDAPAQLNTPRGLLIPAFRRSLLVADSGNHRVQLFDLNSRQLADIWGPTIQGQEMTDQLNSFDTPWALESDTDGNVYVLDYGRAVIHKFDRAGENVLSFAETILQTGILSRPADIAVHGSGQTTRIYVIDQGHNAVFVFDRNGNPIPDDTGQPLSIGAGKLSSPLGIAVSEEAIYVGDNQLRRILTFRNGMNYEYVGEAIGYRGPVAALTLDSTGSLFVHTGASRKPLKLAVTEGYRTQGFLWSDTIVVDRHKVNWHRLQARIAKRGTGAVRLFVHTANDESDSPQVDLNSESLNPFSDPRWVPLAGSPDLFSSVDDLFINSEPSSTFWVGALLRGDGQTTPSLSQLRLEFNHSSYLKHLPAIYTEKDSTRFLLRFLSLFESFFDELEESIADLPSLLDPQTVAGDFLSWLGGWLALDLDRNWDEQTTRRIISRAFEMYGRRGTVEGLQECLSVFAGLKALITEPILDAAWFCLPSPAEPCACQSHTKSKSNKAWGETENSILGVTSMLAPGHPQGAVLGATATLDNSNLLTNEEFGAPLFAELAHRFTVLVYQSQLNCAETLPKIRAAIEREKPAHTVYHLCTIQPRMRVGFQARVGIDSVVGGLPSQASLGIATVGEEVLGGEPQGFAGPHTRVGIDTRVG